MRHMNDIMAIIIANRKGREHTGSEKRRECVDRVSSIGSSSLYSSLVSSMLLMMPSSWGWGVWPFDSRSYDMLLLLLLFFERNTRRPDLSEGNWPEPRDCEFIVIAGAYYRPVLFCLQLSPSLPFIILARATLRISRPHNSWGLSPNTFYGALFVLNSYKLIRTIF